MTLDKLPIFVACVEQGSFAAAARKLGLSRSSIAKAVGALERELGVRLFHRSTRAVAPTAEGTALFAAARRSLAELDSAMTTLREHGTMARGTLRLTVPTAVGRLVSPILCGLAVENPELKLDIQFTDRLVDLIEEGLDLAIRVGTLADSAVLRTRRVGTMPMCVCAAPGYLARHDMPTEVGALQRLEAIVYGTGARRLLWELRTRTGETVLVDPEVRAAFDDLDAINEAVLSGLGVGWLPRWMVAKHLASGALTEIVSDSAADGFSVHALWPASPVMPVRTRMAIDLLSETLPSELAG